MNGVFDVLRHGWSVYPPRRSPEAAAVSTKALLLLPQHCYCQTTVYCSFVSVLTFPSSSVSAFENLPLPLKRCPLHRYFRVSLSWLPGTVESAESQPTSAVLVNDDASGTCPHCSYCKRTITHTVCQKPRRTLNPQDSLPSNHPAPSPSSHADGPPGKGVSKFELQQVQ